MADPQDEPEVAARFPNLKTPTLGGKQFWTDHVWRQGWRIQQHAFSGHWRLLDAKNVRHAWGTRAACDAVLREEQPVNTIEGQHLVLLLHGLMRSSESMKRLGGFIDSKTDKTVAYFDYASSRAKISDHAAALRELVSQLPPEVAISFVGHSMGCIVVRHALGDWQRAGEPQTLERIKQVVMLGPPNQGSSIARQLAKTGVFGWFAGKGGLELGPEWEKFEAQLAIPACPFGIVAGRLPSTSLQNPFVDGAGDFVVSVEETRLPGASDFLEVPRLHTVLMDDLTVQQAVVNFLERNRFN